jgi:prepilin-type processing-associated H-X9-DG protein
MISFKLKYLALPVLALSALAFPACSDNEGEGDGIGGGDITMRLTVDTGMASSASRADAPDGFESPEGEFEKVTTLRVIILRGVPEGQNGVGTVEANKLVRTNPQGYPYDNLEFKVMDNEIKRVYLIANEASIPHPAGASAGETTTAYLDRLEKGDEFNTTAFADWAASAPGNNPDISGAIFSNTPGQTGLPLTEWFDVPVLNNSPGRTDTPADRDSRSISVHLFLTRAAAKASFNVKIDDSFKASGTTITAIRLNGLNYTEYIFPRNAEYSPAKIVTPTPSESGTVERYITSFDSWPRTIDGGCHYTVNNLSIPVQAGTNSTVGPIYFPESKFKIDGKFTVEVLLDGDKGNTTWLTAQPLGVGEGNNILMVDGHQAIARNTHLKITINFNSTGVNFTTEVLPYIGVNLNPDFGFDQLKPKN